MNDESLDRAEKAFRDAFAQHAGDIDPLPLPRRRRWWFGVAAACLLLVALAIPVSLLWSRPDSMTAEPAETTGLPTPEAGWKWVSEHDVAVQVPESWERAITAYDLRCNPTMRVPEAPKGGWADPDAPCPPDAPLGQRGAPAVFFTLDPKTAPAEAPKARRLGRVTVTVLLPPDASDDQLATADRILASLRTSMPADPTRLSGLPDPMVDWKWVSRGHAAVQVPIDWEFSNWPWAASSHCVSTAKEPDHPYVGSPPGPIWFIACAEPAEFTQPRLLFETSREAPEAGVSVDVAGTLVTVALPLSASDETWALAEEIISTAVAFERDDAGCLPISPITSNDDRPAPWDLTTAGGVTAVGICQYDEVTAQLRASRVLDDPEAADLIAAIAAAPEGLLNDPTRCADSVDPGIVLRILDATGTHDVYLRSGGCRNVGFDDGVTQRGFTRAGCAPIFDREPVRFDGFTFDEEAVCVTP